MKKQKETIVDDELDFLSEEDEVGSEKKTKKKTSAPKKEEEATEEIFDGEEEEDLAKKKAIEDIKKSFLKINHCINFSICIIFIFWNNNQFVIIVI